jgi:hypothetical protein
MIGECSNDFENAKGSIGEKRQNAAVQVQNRYRRSAEVSSDHKGNPLPSPRGAGQR